MLSPDRLAKPQQRYKIAVCQVIPSGGIQGLHIEPIFVTIVSVSRLIAVAQGFHEEVLTDIVFKTLTTTHTHILTQIVSVCIHVSCMCLAVGIVFKIINIMCY